MIEPSLFKNEGPTKGKSVSALLHAEKNRNSVIRLFGGIENIPSSIMRIKRPGRIKAIEDEPVSKRGYNGTMRGLEKSKDRKLPGIVRRAHTSSGKGCEAGALSTFPQAIGRSMVLLYSEPGQTVFDPFAGHNSRIDLCVKEGRHYIGCDLSTEFMAFNQKRADKLREQFPDVRIKLHHCDSRKVPVKSSIGDFTITSPPYYDIEYYGDEPQQLGKSKTYKDFIVGLGKVMKENFRVLKPGAFAIWFVNDFRRKGRFHAYHVDTIRIAKKAGFIQHDLLVVDLGNSIRDCFTNQIITSKILPKRHEFGLVFRKPLE
jgi:SAM-dependent methyltransferase